MSKRFTALLPLDIKKQLKQVLSGGGAAVAAVLASLCY